MAVIWKAWVKSALGYMGVIRKEGQLLIKHAFAAQRVFESLGGLVDQAGVAIGALDGGLRGEPKLGAVAVHVNERCRVAKIDDNGGASANVSSQLPCESPIVPYLVHASHSVPVRAGNSVVGVAPYCNGFSDQDRVRWTVSQASAATITPRTVE
jgi:hypothetical protein